jgi:predicted patatin/cPLA2 family phospholipase
LAEPVAVHTALAQGATHLLVLRTHAAAHAPAEPPSVVDALVRRWLRRHAAGVLAPWAARVEQAESTETLLDELEAVGRVLQVRPPDDAPPVSRVSTDTGLLTEALRIGQEAAEVALGEAPRMVGSCEA